MSVTSILRTRFKSARSRGVWWVRPLDLLRLVPSAEGRARLLTIIIHRNDVHQTTPFTSEDRYPELFDVSARYAAKAERILSFGCSTGEELVALRRRFPAAAIVGVEINARARRIAARKVAHDLGITVVPPSGLSGKFDLIFALAVFQREPVKTEEANILDLTRVYPFNRFDAAIKRLLSCLRPTGLLCVANSHYRVEDSSVAPQLVPIEGAPIISGVFFGPDSKRLDPAATTHSLFRKKSRRH